MADAKVVSRLRKLLALAASSNSHEATSASEKARRLMERHGLTEADAAVVGEDEVVEVSLGARGFAQDWKFALAAVAARARDCEALGLRVGRRRKVRVVGRRRDAEEAVRLFHLLSAELRLLARGEMVEVVAVFRSFVSGPGGVRRLSARYLDSFRHGAVAGFRKNLWREGDSPPRSPSRGGEVGEGLVKARDRSVRDRLVASGAREVRVGAGGDLTDDVAYASGFEQAVRVTVVAEAARGPGSCDVAEAARESPDPVTN